MSTPILDARAVRTPHGITAHRPFSLQVDAGDRVWITGRSGIGKTTLLYALGGLSRPTAGDVLLEGRSLVDQPSLRCDRVSFVLQDAGMVEHWSVEQNAVNACGPDRASTALALLREWGVPCAGARPRNLSGGERQRVAAAIALARGTRLVIADEPTASLDEVNRSAVLSAFMQFPADVAVIVSSHDPTWRPWCTRHIDLGAEAA